MLPFVADVILQAPQPFTTSIHLTRPNPSFETEVDLWYRQLGSRLTQCCFLNRTVTKDKTHKSEKAHFTSSIDDCGLDRSRHAYLFCSCLPARPTVSIILELVFPSPWSPSREAVLQDEALPKLIRHDCVHHESAFTSLWYLETSMAK